MIAVLYLFTSAKLQK